MTTASHRSGTGADGPIPLLRERLARYSAARYPVQRATTLFHLGVALTDGDTPAEAIPVLRESCSLFDPERLPVEHAKAQNALGAALRSAGSVDEAAQSFERAGQLFADAGLQPEEGAARFNLGLALHAAGRLEDASAALAAARDLLRGSPLHAAAAARELGAVLVQLGEPDEAAELLTDATDRAERAGDRAGAGAARNARGLAELARGRLDAAVSDFRAAAHAHPRGLRPAEHAMAKANLATAYARAGELAQARLAAAQALGCPVVPDPVRRQAEATLAEAGGAGAGDVIEVLAAGEPEAHLGVVRDELARWTAEPGDVRRAEARAWIDAQVSRPEPAAIELAELLLGALLELPPEQMEALIRSTLEAAAELPPDRRESFESSTSQAMSRFHVPQLMRLRDTFERIAGESRTGAWR